MQQILTAVRNGLRQREGVRRGGLRGEEKERGKEVISGVRGQAAMKQREI